MDFQGTQEISGEMQERKGESIHHEVLQLRYILDSQTIQKEIAYVYDELEKIIPNKYVKIIALPFGSPYKKTHENYNTKSVKK